MQRPYTGKRRKLIRFIVAMILVQAGILAYLSTLLRSPESRDMGAEPTIAQFQLPTRPPRSEAEPSPESTSAPSQPELAEVFAGPPIAATNYTRRALMFDEEQALDHLDYLASDDLGGRQPGTLGGRAAAEYISASFAEYGLQPAGVNNSFFQTFTVPYGRITGLPELTVTSLEGESSISAYAYRTDYRVLTGGYIGAGTGEGPVVWLSECLHDDYAGLDMVGKIALCRYSRDSQIYRQAIEHQVGGLLLLDREGRISLARRPGYRETSWVPQTIPTYLISDTVAADLLAGTELTLDGLSLRYTPTPLSTTVWMVANIEEQEAVEARNVLGFLVGSSPARSKEIVVISAHYDHLGREPDGEVMNGANDNASGVATMLEIARLWQEQNYRPDRSVLFAAWDGEEQGLLGSHYYAQNPAFPLTRTIAMLNLDMVGAGEALRIDGGGTIATQLQTSADLYGITATLTFDGRSDHISFYEAGIPAANLIWWPDTYYHTPNDKIEVIEPDKLKKVGVLSSHALAALTSGHVELEQAIERLRTTILAGDKDAFLAGIDPQDVDLRASQLAWVENLWSQDLVQVVIHPSQIRVGDGEANATLTVSYAWSNSTRPTRSISYDVRFIQRDDKWYFAGYQLDTVSSDLVTISRFPDVAVGAQQLLSRTHQAYLSIATGLGLEPAIGTRFIYYPDAPTMRAIARPSTDQATRWLVSSAGLAEIAWGHPITPALVHLALNQMGLPPDEGQWLREGLIRHYEKRRDTGRLASLAATNVLTPLLDFPDMSRLSSAQEKVLGGYAWSATEYLLDRYGTEGLRALCAAWSRGGNPDEAFHRALDLSASQFESAWRAQQIIPLQSDAAAIRETIADRVEAVLKGDQTAFLTTVNPADSVLGIEERNWFADMVEHSIADFAATGEIVDWSPNNKEAIVELRITATTANGQRSQITYDARFVRNGERWYYADVVWHQLASDHFTLKYQDHGSAWAQRVLTLVERAYGQITTDLTTGLPPPQEIKLYDDDEVFRTLVSLSLPERAGGWSEPGEAIKIPLLDDNPTALLGIIVHELAHQMLAAQGLEVDWLQEGLANLAAGRTTPLGTHRMAGRYLPIVQDAVRRHNEFSLFDMPAWEDVPDDDVELFYAQTWSLVSFIAERYGMPALRQFISQSLLSADTATNLQTALDIAPETFQELWRESAYTASAPDDLVSLAQRFDPERALAHIALLSSPDFGGREAGAPGANLTSGYIAEQFADLGLEPLGDFLPPTPTTSVTGSMTTTLTRAVTQTTTPVTAPAGDTRGYLQQFPISHTHLIRVPSLVLLDEEGDDPLWEFVYNDEFVDHVGVGESDGELVWLRSGSLEGLHFGGAVVLQRNARTDAAYAAQLQARGAGGLIAANERESDDLQVNRILHTAESGATIPVFEITEVAFEVLLEQLGMRYRDLIAFQSPALPLGARVHQSLPRAPVVTTHTANVLGLLPGSDSDLAAEVLLVGAHYDHVGQSPDGLYFPGANQNASGVGALLEMVRVWQLAGYRPARSVLLAVWGAEEIDSTGVARYLVDPAIPLTRTVGVIALDSIAGGDGNKLLFYGTREHDGPLIHRTEASATELERRAWRRGSTGEGWHELFSQADIPTLKLIWDDAEGDFYSLTDTADAIDINRLAGSGEILTLTAAWLARR